MRNSIKLSVAVHELSCSCGKTQLKTILPSLLWAVTIAKLDVTTKTLEKQTHLQCIIRHHNTPHILSPFTTIIILCMVDNHVSIATAIRLSLSIKFTRIIFQPHTTFSIMHFHSNSIYNTCLNFARASFSFMRPCATK